MQTLNSVPKSVASSLPEISGHYAELLTPTSVATITGVPRPTIYWWLRTGRLPSIKIGGKYRIHPSSLSALVTESEPRFAPTPTTQQRIAVLLIASYRDQAMFSNVGGTNYICQSAQSALQICSEQCVDVLCCDTSFPAEDVDQVIDGCLETNPDAKILLLQSDRSIGTPISLRTTRCSQISFATMAAGAAWLQMLGTHK